MGCEARKIPADAEVFFLDFPFYRTYQAGKICWRIRECASKKILWRIGQ
jgi:hypothetical protein